MNPRIVVRLYDSKAVLEQQPSRTDLPFYGILYNHEFTGRHGAPFRPKSSPNRRGPRRLDRLLGYARHCLDSRSDSEITLIAMFADGAAGYIFDTWYVPNQEDFVSHSGPAEEEGLSAREQFMIAMAMERSADLESGEDGRPLWSWDNVWPSVSDLLHRDIQNNSEFSLAFMHEDGTELGNVDRILPKEVLAVGAIVEYVRATNAFWRRHWSNDWVMHAMSASECLALAERQQPLVAAPTADQGFAARLREEKSRAARTRWSRLEPAKARAREIFNGRTWASRAEAVRKMKGEIMAMAANAGVPLSAANAASTIDSWLKGENSVSGPP